MIIGIRVVLNIVVWLLPQAYCNVFGLRGIYMLGLGMAIGMLLGRRSITYG